jgi:ADP-heptose:LPS heptosyltransferase
MILKGDKDKLFIGPFIGEFGHELFSWQAQMREYAKTFDHVVVASRKEYEFLYEDFCDVFLPVDVGTFNAATYDVLERVEENKKLCKKLHSKYNVNKKYTVISPTLESEPVTRGKVYKMKADYLMYGEKTDKKYDVIIHPRNFGSFTGTLSHVKKSRDWDLTKWNDLVNNIIKEGYSVATIGLSSSASYIENTEDLRDIPLKELANVLHNSKCIIGPSSGPMHFATLCGCPQVVWSHPCNKSRYLKNWNPFNIYVTFHDADNWNPSVKTVMKLFGKLINDTK